MLKETIETNRPGAFLLNKKNYDIGVVGLGAVGLSCLKGLSSTGANVIGVDALPVKHNKGSSLADTRIFRTAYFEDPSYVPVLVEAFESWKQWNDEYQANCSKDQRDSNEKLFDPTGISIYGDPHISKLVKGTKASAELHSLPIQIKDQFLQKEESKWEQAFNFPHGFQRITEEMAGVIHAERTLKFLRKKNSESTIELVYENPIVEIESKSNGFYLHSETDSIFCEKVILTAGPWLQTFFPEINIDIEVNFHMWWKLNDFAPKNVFAIDSPQGFIYGFPSQDGQTVKINLHGTGLIIDHPNSASAIEPVAIKLLLQDMIEQFLPYQSPRLLDFKQCLYTNSFDGHFLIDEAEEGFLVMGAMSGHGFKFLPAIASSAVEFFDPTFCGTKLQNPNLLNLNLFKKDRLFSHQKNL